MERKVVTNLFKVTEPMDAMNRINENDKMINKIKLVGGVVGGAVATGAGLLIMKAMNISNND